VFHEWLVWLGCTLEAVQEQTLIRGKLQSEGAILGMNDWRVHRNSRGPWRGVRRAGSRWNSAPRVILILILIILIFIFIGLRSVLSF
jgi:hypothetical protein